MQKSTKGRHDVQEMEKHFLYPGAIFAHGRPHIVTTILGSCVAVCLWDHVLRIGGVNHFQLALWNGEGLASPKYGNIAVEKLIEKMLSLGSQKRNLKAKIFGGGAVIGESNGKFAIGERNIILATDMLADERIPVVSSAVGGFTGRHLKFNTESGVALVKPVKKT